MYRNEDIPNRIRLAILMLIALLMLSMQQHVLRNFFSDVSTITVEAEKQLTLKQSYGTTNHLGIVHDESLLSLAFVLAISFLITLFPFIKENKVIRYAPTPLSRNFCCIVPKGP